VSSGPSEPFHCPNFIPNDVDFNWLTKSKDFVRHYYARDPWMVDNIMDRANFTNTTSVIPLRVRYHSGTLFHESLVHMWKDWYDDYFFATFPRLIVRLEDLTYHPRAVLQQVCDCAGGTLAANLSLVERSAIVGGDNIHGTNRTGLLEAIYRHVHGNRTHGMTREDAEFARQVLEDSDVRLEMSYQIPSRGYPTSMASRQRSLPPLSLFLQWNVVDCRQFVRGTLRTAQVFLNIAGLYGVVAIPLAFLF
jgi:hypothetical protein